MPPNARNFPRVVRAVAGTRPTLRLAIQAGNHLRIGFSGTSPPPHPAIGADRKGMSIRAIATPVPQARIPSVAGSPRAPGHPCPRSSGIAVTCSPCWPREPHRGWCWRLRERASDRPRPQRCVPLLLSREPYAAVQLQYFPPWSPPYLTTEDFASRLD